LAQIVIPSSIADNLKFGIRPYQEEAFKRYIFLDQEELDEKPNKPYHLLYNRTRGNGKTIGDVGANLCPSI
jgi:type III restriction enzyme